MAAITDADINHVWDDGYVASDFLLFGADTIAAGRQSDPNDGLITGLRYQNIPIPKNSAIISASLKFRAVGNPPFTRLNVVYTSGGRIISIT